MNVTILSLFSNRPDFIKPQYESAKKHLKDDFYYIVVNNSYFGVDKPKEIEETAQKEGTGYLRVRHGGKKTEPSALVKDTLNFLWKDFKKVEGILAIMDCDLFFIKDVSFNQLLDGHDMAFCPIYTEGKVWPWTGLMLFDMSKIKADDISFSFACLDGKKYQDVGSAMHSYVIKHNPKIKLLKRDEILNEDKTVKDKKLSELGFPLPYSIDLVEDFLIHYKTSSNYAPHCTLEYNKQKTEALMKIL